MIYYMIKVNSTYDPINYAVLNQIKTSDSVINKTLKYVSVSSCLSIDYDGSDIIGTYDYYHCWRLGEKTYPQYIIFSSEYKLNNLLLRSGGSGGLSCFVKDIEVFKSPTLLDYTDTNWKLLTEATFYRTSNKLYDQVINLKNTNLLIDNVNNIYTAKTSQFDTSTNNYIPFQTENIDETTFANYGMDVSQLYNNAIINNNTLKPIEHMNIAYPYKILKQVEP